MYLNKRGVVEITSFIFILSIVVVGSLIAYAFSKNYMNDSISQLDLENMKIYLTKIDQNFKKYQNFNSSTFTFFIKFSTGSFKIQGNQLIFLSQVKGDYNICYDSGICEFSENGFLGYYLNLTNNYQFNQNISLLPGQYSLVFITDKYNKKISYKIY